MPSTSQVGGTDAGLLQVNEVEVASLAPQQNSGMLERLCTGTPTCNAQVQLLWYFAKVVQGGIPMYVVPFVDGG